MAEPPRLFWITGIQRMMSLRNDILTHNKDIRQKVPLSKTL